MANDPIQFFNNSLPAIPNYTPLNQPDIMSSEPNTTSVLPSSFRCEAPVTRRQFIYSSQINQFSASLPNWAKFGVNRSLDILEPLGRAIGTVSDYAVGGFVSAGKWWNSWKSENSGIFQGIDVTNKITDAIGNAKELSDAIEAANRASSNSLPLPASGNGLGTIGLGAAKVLSTATCALDLLGAFAKDEESNSKGAGTISTAIECVVPFPIKITQ